jgi:6-phosphogluconolactonase
MKEIVVCSGAANLYRAVAEFLVTYSNSIVSSLGRCVIALPGGNTPRGFFQLLAHDPYRSALPWLQLHFFWGDERCVPWDHPESNYGLAYETFLGPLSIPKRNIHGIVVEDHSPVQSAEDYEQELRDFFQLGPGKYPRFDLILLGMGVDGHTASLFPGGPELGVRKGLVTWAQPKASSTARITLTLGTINRARHVVFLVSGANKAATLRRVLDGEEKFPAALVQPREGMLTFFIDEATGVDPSV